MIGLFETDGSARILVADDVATALIANRGPATGRTPWAAASPTRRTEIEREWSTRSTDGFETHLELTTDDVTRRARVVMSPRLDTDGSLVGYVGTVVVDGIDDDLTLVVHHTRDVVLGVDAEGGPTFANDSARRLVGSERVAGLASTVRDQVPRGLLRGSIPDWRGDVVVRDLVGDTITLDCRVIRSSTGGFTAWCRDVTASAQLQAELAHQATHDPLTGLPDRQLFVRHVAEAIERARVGGRALAVLYVDIDHLKTVNDTLGHDSGDEFIGVVGRRLAASTRPGDVVGRMGGDEFVVLCEGVGDDGSALDVAERIVAAAAEPVTLSGHRLATGVSIGVASWHPNDRLGSAHDGPSEVALELVRRADTAMYRAKSRGKGRCETFTEAMGREAARRGRLRLDLERALADDRLRLVFQPIAALYTGRIEATEALLRWDHPSEGILTPSDFVDLAEETGLVIPIGDWVVDRSLETLAAWIADGRADRHFRMHVNVSLRQIVDSEVVEKFAAAVKRHGLTPANLAIEYRADVLDEAEAARTLGSLRRLGFLLTLDDFGDRRSALSDLTDCAPHFVKLAGSFVRPLDVDDRDDPMVRGVVRLAHGLDAAVIASWVVSDRQLERLRAIGCDHVQGFHVARPIRSDDFDPSVIEPRLIG